MTDAIDKKELKKIRDELFKQQQDFSLRIRDRTDPNRPPYGGPSWSERKDTIARRVEREKKKKKRGFMEGEMSWPEMFFGVIVVAPIGWFLLGIYFVFFIRFLGLFLSLPIPAFWSIVIWGLACIGGTTILYFLMDPILYIMRQIRKRIDK